MDKTDIKKTHKSLYRPPVGEFAVVDTFLPANGLTEAGHHHEIYLSDPRKTTAEQLKTVLRQPVRPAA